jgi:hypothetical protein
VLQQINESASDSIHFALFRRAGVSRLDDFRCYAGVGDVAIPLPIGANFRQAERVAYRLNETIAVGRAGLRERVVDVEHDQVHGDNFTRGRRVEKLRAFLTGLRVFRPSGFEIARAQQIRAILRSIETPHRRHIR